MVDPRLRTHAAGGGLGVQRFRLRTPACLLGPKWAGEMLAAFPSHPPIPLGSLLFPADLLTMSGSLPSLGTPTLSQTPLRVPIPSCLYFSSPLPPFHAPRPHIATGGLRGGKIWPWTSACFRGPSGWGKCWPCSLPILLSPFGLVPSPLIPSW